MQQITLTFNNQTITVQANQDGMFNLNEIARGFNLREPSQWRNAQKRVLLETANLQALRNENQRQGEAPVSLYGTQTGLYAYAAWADPTQQFFVKVVECFTAITNGDLEAAVEIASEVVQVREGLRQGNSDLSNTMADHYSGLITRAGEFSHFASSVHRMIYKLATNTRMPLRLRGRNVRDELVADGNAVALTRMTTLYGMYSVLAESGLEYLEIKSKLEAYVDKKAWYKRRIR